jgi:hypothetical protein
MQGVNAVCKDAVLRRIYSADFVKFCAGILAGEPVRDRCQGSSVEFLAFRRLW